MSHSAMSIAESAYIAGPLRPTPVRLRCSSSMSAAIALGSRPTHIGPIRVSSAALVAGKMRCPKPSPQPVTPPSVSTRTSSVSMLVRGRPPCCGSTGPSITIGMLTTIVSTLVILISAIVYPVRRRAGRCGSRRWPPCAPVPYAPTACRTRLTRSSTARVPSERRPPACFMPVSPSSPGRTVASLR